MCPWERTQNIREMHGWRYALGVSGSSHILDTQVLGLDTGKRNALNGCRATWTNRKSVGSPESPLQELVLRSLLPTTMKRTD